MPPAGIWHRGVVIAVAAATALVPLTASADSDPVDLGRASDYVSAPDLTTRWADTNEWFVEFESKPTGRGGSRAEIARQRRAFVDKAKRAGHAAEVSATYERLFNGVAVEADAETAEAYAELSGVVAVYPVVPVTMPKPQTAPSALGRSLAQSGADIAQTQLSLDGAGIKVGVIDSGIDIDHPDLGGNGTNGSTTFPTQRVAYGYDFVGDDYTGGNAPLADNNPDDCQGHGTHVAGIVGASGSHTGVAPNVTFGAYRVFGCSGSTSTAVLASAMERADADGMDVVNMSLGASMESWPSYPTAQAADVLVSKGVVVVAAAGNDGDLFTQATGAPSVAPNTISVASYDNNLLRLKEAVFNAASGPISAGYLPADGSVSITTALNGRAITATADPLACVPQPSNLGGKIAIASRGTCSFHQKAVTAQNAGASALVIYNNEPGYLDATVEGATAVTIPVITIDAASGQAVIGALAGGTVTFQITGKTTTQPNPSGGLISAFSSWGLAADLTLKPDLGAPGGQIYSTYPLEKSPYATLNGTSMAAPHVAGAVALLLQAHPTLTPAEVLTRLQNTAAPTVFSLNPGTGVLDAAHHQGAGHIQIDRAVQHKHLVSPGKISARESADGPHTQALTISNRSSAPVTWTLDHENAVSTYLDVASGAPTQNNVGFSLEPTRVTFSATQVTVPAGGTATVNVTIAPDPSTDEGTQYSGFIFLRADEGATVLSVPFAGMAGDYGKVPAFPQVGDFPAVVQPTDCAVTGQECTANGYAAVAAGHNFTGGTHLPTVAVHQGVPVSRLTMDVLKVGTDGRPIQSSRTNVSTWGMLGRSMEFDLYKWDGRLKNSSKQLVDAAPGVYMIELTALGADGDGGTQVWTSAPFGYKLAATTPTPTPTPTVVPTPTPTPTLSASPTPTPVLPPPSPTWSPSPTSSATPTPTVVPPPPTPTPTATPTATSSPTGTPTVTAGPTPSLPPTPTWNPTVSATPTIAPTPPPSATPTPTLSPVPTVTAQPTTPTKAPQPTQSPTPPAAVVIAPDVYNTPGSHLINGRRWFTTCEPYSQTTRCRTEIFATQVNFVGGKFVQESGFVFNNLTYVQYMTRAQWGTNPLARNTTWLAADGRRWRTECDTAATGRGGCRTYIQADVVEAAAGGYRWATKEILNNMVRFKD